MVVLQRALLVFVGATRKAGGILTADICFHSRRPLVRKAD